MVLRNSEPGLDGLVSGGPVEIVKAGDVRDRFKDVNRLYEQFLNLSDIGKLDNNYEIGRTWLVENVADVLTPSEVNLFLKITKNSEEHIRYNSDDGRTGLFMTRLLQRSYDSGKHNDFALNMGELEPLHRVGYKLIGNSERKWNITVNGEVGHWCLYSARSIGNVKIGTAKYGCLSYAKSIGNVKIGTAGGGCLFDAQNIGNVYTTSPRVNEKLIKTEIQFKRGCGLRLVSSLDEVPK